MRVKHALTLQNQLALPLIPFCIDLFARVVFLGGKVPWYQLPDLWTFLVTYAFFCLGLMVSVTPVALPTDLDANVNAELVRQRLLGTQLSPFHLQEESLSLGSSTNFFLSIISTRNTD